MVLRKDSDSSKATQRIGKGVIAAGAVVAVAVVLLLSRALFFDVYTVASWDMDPTLLVDDCVVALKPGAKDAGVGDIVGYSAPETDSNIPLIGRIVAVGGQHVTFEDDNVYVDGEVLDEPYLMGALTPARINKEDGGDEEASGANFKVPEGQVWILGDARGRASDSREFGPVSRDDIVSVVKWRVLPFNEAGAL